MALRHLVHAGDGRAGRKAPGDHRGPRLGRPDAGHGGDARRRRQPVRFLLARLRPGPDRLPGFRRRRSTRWRRWWPSRATSAGAPAMVPSVGRRPGWRPISPTCRSSPVPGWPRSVQEESCLPASRPSWSSRQSRLCRLAASGGCSRPRRRCRSGARRRHRLFRPQSGSRGRTGAVVHRPRARGQVR